MGDLRRRTSKLNWRNTAEVIRFLVEIGVLVVAALALWSTHASNEVAREGNRLMRETVASQLMPWPRVDAIQAAAVGPNMIEIKYSCRNFGQGPALRFMPTLIWEGVEGQTSATQTALMPGEEAKFRFRVTLAKASATEALEALNQGGLPLRFEFDFLDQIGRQFQIRHNIRAKWDALFDESFTIHTKDEAPTDG